MRNRPVLKAAPAPIAILAAAAMLATTPAAAQATEAARQDDARDADPGDIIVTAQKREQLLMDVPAAISAVTGAEIEDKGYANISDLLQRAPGVSLTPGTGTTTVQVRGVSSLFGAATVGYYLDELPFSLALSPQMPDIRSWDLERVEILRGPQGTLYGANSIGGTIRTLTKNPDLTRFEIKGEAGIGFIRDGQQEWEVKGAINVPIVEDRIAIRLAATHYETGGFVDSALGKDIDDAKVTTLRGKIALAPTERLRITLSAWSSDRELDNPANARRNRVSTNPLANPIDIEFRTFGGVIEQEMPGFDIVSATSYLKFKYDGLTTLFFGGAVLPNVGTIDAKTFAQEVRLVSTGAGPLRWTAGGYYQNSREVDGQVIPAITESSSREKSEAWAVFGELGYRLDAIEATLGLRYFHDTRTSSSVVVGAPPFAPIKGSYGTLNPKFNLSWHVDEDSLLYGTVAKGFRSGQNQPASSLFTAGLFGIDVPVQIDPETLWSYEIGSKNSFLDGRLTVEAALYYNAWKDLQVTIVAGGLVGALVNAGKAHSMGADLAISYRPVKGLNLAVSGNINESKLDSTVPTAFNKGDRIVNVPKYTLNASATYLTPLTDRLNFFGFAELQQGARRYLSAQGFTGQSDPQSILNARIGVEGKGWGLYLTGQNLLDETGFTSPAISTTDFNSTIPQPRTIGVLLRANY